MKSLPISFKEAEKVTHDINNIWHACYEGQRNCVIYTHSYQKNSPSYEYHFINYGFDQYAFVAKYPTEDRRKNHE